MFSAPLSSTLFSTDGFYSRGSGNEPTGRASSRRKIGFLKFRGWNFLIRASRKCYVSPAPSRDFKEVAFSSREFSFGVEAQRESGARLIFPHVYVQFSRSLIEPCFPILSEGNELIIIVKITTIIATYSYSSRSFEFISSSTICRLESCASRGEFIRRESGLP